MPNQTSSVEINPEFRNGTDATYGAVGAATSAQRLLRLRAAKPQAPIMSRKRNSPNARPAPDFQRSEEHTSELQSRLHLVCRLLLEKKKKLTDTHKWETPQ